VNDKHGRERSIEALLRQTAPGGRALEPSADCLDAERAAAWFDGGLAPAERSRVEAHLADCAWCQALVGGVARTEPALPAPAKTPTTPRWLGWLLPIAATAAIIVAVRVLPDDTAAPVPSSADAVSAERDEAKPQASAPPPARAAEPAAGAARRNERATAPPAALGRTADAEARRATPPAAAVEAELFMQKAAEILVASPDPDVRWRILASSIERTTDGGLTWRSSPMPADGVVAAGAAPTATTCWLVGRGGLVLLSPDGTAWERVAFPEAVDLTAVEAADGLTAAVTTADGRRFRTIDGGRTWSREPLQEN
jgi:hypothetical protein